MNLTSRFGFQCISAVFLAWAALGCSSAPVSIPVTPEMRQFVSSQYENVVGDRIGPHDSALIRPPKSINATYNVAEHFTYLRAQGDVQTRNDRGNTFNGWYDLRWY